MLHTPGVHHRAGALWLRGLEEVDTKGLCGLVPYVSQAARGGFVSFQMENESKRRAVLVRS